MRLVPRQLLHLDSPRGRRIIRIAGIAREWFLLKLSGVALRLGHRVLVAGARAFWAGAIGKAGLRNVLRISSRLDRVGMRLMRQSIRRRRAESRDRYW
ncbi:hypothetical protein BPNPMPFG_001663 [Mesorhizobium sp. AR07]|uniref:hypothetical protein n=1 Tax=Mesorhizobium sp. AR07 TaxID=2865838 RepID=UPI00215F4013|nr:hypothetical protein [Mesorhizobium sp. AR07]UVK46063.1 hypothetical protein BPNPMPFG_001663 [Mesorhizobium sp. AR07]